MITYSLFRYLLCLCINLYLIDIWLVCDTCVSVCIHVLGILCVLSICYPIRRTNVFYADWGVVSLTLREMHLFSYQMPCDLYCVVHDCKWYECCLFRILLYLSCTKTNLLCSLGWEDTQGKRKMSFPYWGTKQNRTNDVQRRHACSQMREGDRVAHDNLGVARRIPVVRESAIDYSAVRDSCVEADLPNLHRCEIKIVLNYWHNVYNTYIIYTYNLKKRF